MSYKWKISQDLKQDLPEIFVHILDFPQGNLFVWIGNSEGQLSNLAMGLKRQKQALSTAILNPMAVDEASNKSKILSQRLSELLGGRQVLLSYSVPDLGPLEDLLDLQGFEIELCKVIKSHFCTT